VLRPTDELDDVQAAADDADPAPPAVLERAATASASTGRTTRGPGGSASHGPAGADFPPRAGRRGRPGVGFGEGAPVEERAGTPVERRGYSPAVRALMLAALALTAALAAAPAGQAAFPGRNGAIAFTHAVAQDPMSPPRFRIDTVGPDGSGRRILVGQAQFPAWSADGRRLAYAGVTADGRGRGIFVAAADGSRRVRVTRDPDDGAPAWSPDGRRLVFHRARSPAPGVLVATVYTIRPDGTALRRLARGLFPAWSWTDRIAFVRQVARTGRLTDGIFTVRPDGRELRRVTRRAADSAPDWSPHGTRLVFTRGDRIHKIGADGSRLRRVPRRGSFPAWSPDGRRLVFARGQAIHTIRTDGTRLRTLARSRTGIHDAPDWRPR
jgi:TolB protein